jgi:hypothetical protein
MTNFFILELLELEQMNLNVGDVKRKHARIINYKFDAVMNQ